MWRQPKAVWAVAFAAVIAFMGIGLVDPILKPIADNLGASPSQVSLLFTSYMAVMGVAMLVASAAYSFLRFGGAAVAPWLAGVLGETISVHLPFWVGAGAVLAGAGLLWCTRPYLAGIDTPEGELEELEDEAVAVTVGN